MDNGLWRLHPTKHPVSRKVAGEQIVVWDDIRTAPRKHMEISFRQRRERIVGDCRQLSVDADSYNDASASIRRDRGIDDVAALVGPLEKSSIANQLRIGSPHTNNICAFFSHGCSNRRILAPVW